MLLLLSSVSGCSPATLTTPELSEKCERAIDKGDLKEAGEWAKQIPVETPSGIKARFQLGESLTKAGQYEDAISWYRPISELKDNDDDAIRATFYIAELERELGRLNDAESKYTVVLASEGDDIATRERLAFLLSTTGRAWDGLPHFFFIVKAGTANYTDLCLLGDLERRVDRLDYLNTCAAKNPGDPVVQLGLAAHEFWEGRLAEAESGLRAVVAKRPDFLAGQAMLGELLINRDDAVFVTWHDALPENASTHPGIWLTRGLWARRHQNPEVAARCFWEALRLEPTSRRAVTQIAQILPMLNHPGQAEFQDRAREMTRLTQLIDEVLASEAGREQPVREIAEILDRTGRIWEACGWSAFAHRQFPDAVWPEKLFVNRSLQLTADLPLVLASENLAIRFDLSSYPGIDQLLKKAHSQTPPLSAPTTSGTIRFSEAEQGPAFVYFNGEDPNTPGARSFEQSGGGVGVIDFEIDGVPDLFFPQGKEWPTGSEGPNDSPALKDSLYRQLPRGDYSDMTSVALPADYGFGQGCTVGDFNNDGFPDLYVANVGRNQLLENQGDGTFVDATMTAGLIETDWTASVVIVDLNGDELPDLFDVNYVTGKGVYTAICNGKACSPRAFQGTTSRLHLNGGDGTFAAIPYGPDVRPGKGLGVVCFPLESQRFLSLFISNDQVANQLLQNSQPASGSNANLIDQAFVMGTALNGDGVAMAGMGIAADDVDGNGTVDFYVSNFKDEPNTLLLQDAPGMFVDSTNTSGLKAASLAYVGWGTQFLDADRDSFVDLILTNGHVDDYRDDGGEYHMRPQFFHQKQPGQFEELFEETVGPFFGQKRLGRGLARLDWNRDGLMDVAISHIGDRAALLTNTTIGAGHFLNIRLIATHTARDAIGTRVTVTTVDDAHWTRPLLAGDGYMASNDRLLQFGLGPCTELKDVRIEWPSGAVSVLKSPAVDGTILFVEGMLRAFPQNSEAARSSAVEFRAVAGQN
ncbi:MAG: VCBS repeat-containing protein [Fuerstia sp.]|nr:VCBS repeat-containing protein [Fuerstiella sp.]